MQIRDLLSQETINELYKMSSKKGSKGKKKPSNKKKQINSSKWLMFFKALAKTTKTSIMKQCEIAVKRKF